MRTADCEHGQYDRMVGGLRDDRMDYCTDLTIKAAAGRETQSAAQVKVQYKYNRSCRKRQAKTGGFSSR